MGEFRIERRIGNVAAGRHVEIMHRDRIAQAGAFAEHRGDMAAVLLAAEDLNIGALERQPRYDDDAVIALLAVERDMLVAEPLEALERKASSGHLVSCRQRISGRTALMNLATRSMRSRTELMFQVVSVELHGGSAHSARRAMHRTQPM